MSNQSDARRVRGSVKWFDEKKGFGFIRQDGSEDIFVHYTQIQGDGFVTLTENQEVEFIVRSGPKGLQAIDVEPLA